MSSGYWGACHGCLCYDAGSGSSALNVGAAMSSAVVKLPQDVSIVSKHTAQVFPRYRVGKHEDGAQLET
jgi:hypothetical protein